MHLRGQCISVQDAVDRQMEAFKGQCLFEGLSQQGNL